MGYTVKKNTDKYYIYKRKYKHYKKIYKDLEKEYNRALSKVKLLDSSVLKLKNASNTGQGNMYGIPVEEFNKKCIRYYNLSIPSVNNFKNIINSILYKFSEIKSKIDKYKRQMDYEEANPIIENHKWWWEE